MGGAALELERFISRVAACLPLLPSACRCLERGEGEPLGALVLLVMRMEFIEFTVLASTSCTLNVKVLLRLSVSCGLRSLKGLLTLLSAMDIVSNCAALSAE